MYKRLIIILELWFLYDIQYLFSEWHWFPIDWAGLTNRTKKHDWVISKNNQGQCMKQRNGSFVSTNCAEGSKFVCQTPKSGKHILTTTEETLFHFI